MLLIPGIISHTLYLIFFSRSFFDIFFFVFSILGRIKYHNIYRLWHLAFGNGRAVKKMDDNNSNNMDTSIYRDKFRLLYVFVDTKICSWDIAGSAKLFVSCFRYGQSSWMVLWSLPNAFSFVDCHVYCYFHGTVWLWPSMACHSKTHRFALFYG